MEQQNNNRKDESHNRQDIRNAALGYLARREHSYKELLHKITTKHSFSPVAVETVLDELVESDLLSDHRFAEIYMRSRLNKGFGPERIAMELREKGIDQAIITDCLNDPGIDWAATAFSVWKKKFRIAVEQAPALNYAEKARQSQFLRYRGFRRDDIESVFNELA